MKTDSPSLPPFFPIRLQTTFLLTGVALCGLGTVCAAGGQTLSSPKASKASAKRWWPLSVDKSLAQAGSNRAQLETALQSVPTMQREGMRFLIENMPITDLQTLRAPYLLDTVSMAYEAMNSAPWKQQIPNDVFLNDVLPYASLNEARDESRKMLRDKSLPLIADCKTPAEAAHRLNAKLFPLLNARYSTERKRPDQNPTETIASGKATCSGLSILLVDACRAVGVPARVVGTPLWTNMRGNHTWVEIWDGDWHFLGAAEPDEQGLDKGWFTHDASLAKKDVPQHAIYASSFKKTGLPFPLVWAENIQWVPAVNVTDRYTRLASADAGKTRLLIKALNGAGKRVVAHVTVREVGKPEALLDGSSKGETADLNDMLSVDVFRACPPRHYEATVEYAGKTVQKTFVAGMEAQEVITVNVNAPETRSAAVNLIVPASKGEAKSEHLAALLRIVSE